MNLLSVCQAVRKNYIICTGYWYSLQCLLDVHKPPGRAPGIEANSQTLQLQHHVMHGGPNRLSFNKLTLCKKLL